VGIRESASFNAVMVVIKIVVLLFFIGVAFYFVSPREMAANMDTVSTEPLGGTFAGAAIVFFA